MDAKNDQTVLGAEGICKNFGPVRVLHDVGIAFKKGEVHALIGENGAGKSTLVKILSGYLQPTEGAITVSGSHVQFSGSREAENRGIVMIHQEFNLAPHLTVEGNMFLGRELRKGPFLNKSAMRREARRVLGELGVDIDPKARLLSLPISQVQMVEIGKSLERNTSGAPKVIIMDEPTGVLTPAEAEKLFQLIGRLRARGVTVVYISHKLDEIKRIADRVTVLRDGYYVTTRPARELTEHQMANLMVGREIEDMYPPKEPAQSSDVALRVQHLTVPGHAEDVSFELRKGEILGFAGLIGAGRTEVMEGMMGLRKASADEVKINGEPIRKLRPDRMVGKGVVYLSEDRKGKGLLTSMPMRPNLTLLALRRYCRPFIDTNAELKALKQAVERFDIRASRLDVPVNTLSGGNQQKLALAKIMDVEPQLVILDEPTRGIDVGTKQQIYNFIAELSQRGVACIVISSELPEVIGLSHRVAVMCRGKITGVLSGNDINEQTIMQYAAGVQQEVS